MTEPQNRRAEDKHMLVLATKIERLGEDISEMRASVVKMTDALIKFAVIEERQTQTIAQQARITETLDRMDQRMDAQERACLAQEKEIRALILDTARALSMRIDVLEKSEPLQEQTSKWMMAAVWGAAGLLAMVVAKQLGLL